MMNDMMKHCCGQDGKPEFDKMKDFMKHCGKDAFSDDDVQTMKQFCAQEKMPDVEMMRQVMEKCGYHPS